MRGTLAPLDTRQNTLPTTQESGIPIHEQVRLLCFVADVPTPPLSGYLYSQARGFLSKLLVWDTETAYIQLNGRCKPSPIETAHNIRGTLPRDVQFLVYSQLTSTRGGDMPCCASVTPLRCPACDYEAHTPAT